MHSLHVVTCTCATPPPNPGKESPLLGVLSTIPTHLQPSTGLFPPGVFTPESCWSLEQGKETCLFNPPPLILSSSAHLLRPISPAHTQDVTGLNTWAPPQCADQCDLASTHVAMITCAHFVFALRISHHSKINACLATQAQNSRAEVASLNGGGGIEVGRGGLSQQTVHQKERGQKNHRASKRLGQAINAEGPPRCQMVLGDTPLNNAQNTPDLVSI